MVKMLDWPDKASSYYFWMNEISKMWKEKQIFVVKNQ